MQKIIQSSCSELLVDTRLVHPVDAYKRFTALFAELGWESSPPLTLELLEEIQKSVNYNTGETQTEVTIYDAEGNRAWLEYGDNGYITTGYRFDSQCSDYDLSCYPIFRVAIERLHGQLISCDGGHKEGYEEWRENLEGNNRKS